MARSTLYCPECGAKIPRKLSKKREIMCMNPECLHIFSVDEAVTEKIKKERAPKKHYISAYMSGLKTCKAERLAGIKKSRLRKVGYVILSLIILVYAALFEYTLSLRAGWVSPFEGLFSKDVIGFLNPYAQAISSMLPTGFVLHFPLYNMLFSLNVYAVFIVCISFFFTRYVILFSIRLMRFLLLECTAIYVCLIVVPMIKALGDSMILENAIIYTFSHIWPTFITVLLMSLVKPLVACLCKRSDEYYERYKAKVHA